MKTRNGVTAEFGVVKSFDSSWGMKCGVILVVNANGQETGEEIPYNYHDGAGDDATPLAIPSPGDNIVFWRAASEQCPVVARPWEYDPRSTIVDEVVVGLTDSTEDEYTPRWLIEDLLRLDDEEVVSIERVIRSPRRHFCGNLALAREAGELHPMDFAA